MGNTLEQRTSGLLRYGRAFTLGAILSVSGALSNDASAQSMSPSGAQPEMRATAVSNPTKPKSAPKRKSTSKKFNWKPHPGIIVRTDLEPITLSNGLVIDRRFERTESRMDSLSKWNFSNKKADWDILPVNGYSMILDHTTQSESMKNDITRLQSFGKIHFYIPRGAEWGDTVFSIVPLSHSANQAGTTLLNGSTHLARRAIGIENQSYEEKLLKRDLPCLEPWQITKHNKLTEYLIDKYTISPDSIFTHSDVAMSFKVKALNRKVNADPYYPLPDTIIGTRYSRKIDGICFDRGAMGIPEFVDPDTNRLRINEKEANWRKQKAREILTKSMMAYLDTRKPEMRYTPLVYNSEMMPSRMLDSTYSVRVPDMKIKK